MKQIINDMADVALGMVPKEMARVPAATIIYTLTDLLMDILLMLQTPTSTSRPHCLCCEDPPVPAPRVCDGCFKSVVRHISDGVPNAEVSILPPLREFDPPAYVTLLFNPCGSYSFMTLFISIVFQFLVNSIESDVKREHDKSSRLCRIHQEQFKSLMYRIVTANPACTPHVWYCERSYH